MYLQFLAVSRGPTVKFRQVHTVHRKKRCQRLWPLLGTPEPFTEGTKICFLGEEVERDEDEITVGHNILVQEGHAMWHILLGKYTSASTSEKTEAANLACQLNT